MPSPFPGMDPYIEALVWEGFHTGLIVALQELLRPQICPNYFALVEQRVYIEYSPAEDRPLIRPDAAIVQATAVSERRGGATALDVAPVILSLPMPQEVEEPFLTVRLMDTREVISIIEILSPSNKRPGASGREEYLKKRADVLRSSANLIELDLLRGGERLPTIPDPPPADYYALVSRGNRRPNVECYHWTLRDRMPRIPIPLRSPDPDVALDLQAACTLVMDRAGYSDWIDYAGPVAPRLSPDDAAWAAERIAAATGG